MGGAPSDGPHRVVYVRHPGDVVGVVVGAGLLAVSGWIASSGTVSVVEAGLFHAVNGLPSWLYKPVWLVMQLGSLAAGLLTYFAGLGLKHLVGRARPAALIDDVIGRGPHATGLGFPSGHAAVSFALTATAVPFLARRWRRVIRVLPLTVGLARMFVGAHLPLDVVGGYALGFTVAALVHLAAGAPSGRITADQVRAALSRAGIAVASVWPARVDARGSTPFFAERTDGDGLFVKAVGPDQRDADFSFKTYRFVAYRGLDDEKPIRSAKRQIEVEALLDLLAAKAGVRTPAVVGRDGSTSYVRSLRNG